LPFPAAEGPPVIGSPIRRVNRWTLPPRVAGDQRHLSGAPFRRLCASSRPLAAERRQHPPTAGPRGGTNSGRTACRAPPSFEALGHHQALPRRPKSTVPGNRRPEPDRRGAPSRTVGAQPRPSAGNRPSVRRPGVFHRPRRRRSSSPRRGHLPGSEARPTGPRRSLPRGDPRANRGDKKSGRADSRGLQLRSRFLENFECLPFPSRFRFPPPPGSFEPEPEWLSPSSCVPSDS